jgi:hypothetical protein
MSVFEQKNSETYLQELSKKTVNSFIIIWLSVIASYFSIIKSIFLFELQICLFSGLFEYMLIGFKHLGYI